MDGVSGRRPRKPPSGPKRFYHEKQVNTVKEVHRASLLRKIEKTLISCTGWIVWERNIKAVFRIFVIFDCLATAPPPPPPAQLIWQACRWCFG